jgi:hypothetical protein
VILERATYQNGGRTRKMDFSFLSVEGGWHRSATMPANLKDLFDELDKRSTPEQDRAFKLALDDTLSLARACAYATPCNDAGLINAAQSALKKRWDDVRCIILDILATAPAEAAAEAVVITTMKRKKKKKKKKTKTKSQEIGIPLDTIPEETEEE